MIIVFKKINIKDVIFWLGKSWTDIKQSTLQKSWKNITSNLEVNENSENGDISEDKDNLPLSHLLNQLPIPETITDKDASNWLNGDKQCKLSDEAITNLVPALSRTIQQDITPADHAIFSSSNLFSLSLGQFLSHILVCSVITSWRCIQKFNTDTVTKNKIVKE